MRGDDRLYLQRKEGRNMGWRWTIRSLTPSLLVALITALLVFSMVFISSMTSAIDHMIVLLGSSSIITDEYVDISSIPGARIDEVKGGDGVLFGENGKTLVHLKGVKDDYFNGDRGKAIRLEMGEVSGRNPVIISSTLAKKMEAEIGTAMTMMLYDKEKNRTRPVYVMVSGIFDSGYAQLDRYLAFIDYSVLSGDSDWEILLESEDNVEKIANDIKSKGIGASTYRENYASLYINVKQSVMVLYVILASVALLAAFFSSDIVHVYLSRDSQDIASLRLLGMEERRIREIYTILTLRTLLIASLLGTFLGLGLGMLSPAIIETVARYNPNLIEYYISSFTVKVPWLTILVMLVLMLLLSFVTLTISLKHTKTKDINDVIKDL